MPHLSASSRSARGRVAWLVFALLVLGAWAFAQFAWAVRYYFPGMVVFLALTLAAATWVLLAAPRTPLAWTGVIFGLLVGNFAVLEGCLVTALWSIQGFAP